MHAMLSLITGCFTSLLATVHVVVCQECVGKTGGVVGYANSTYRHDQWMVVRHPSAWVMQ